MGYIRHDAIVVTAWQTKDIEAAAEVARSFGLEVLGPSKPAVNGYQSILICPDGSKEGWRHSDDFDGKRAGFIHWLRNPEDGIWLEWCAVAFGNDDGGAEVTAHAWDAAAIGAANDKP